MTEESDPAAETILTPGTPADTPGDTQNLGASVTKVTTDDSATTDAAGTADRATPATTATASLTPGPVSGGGRQPEDGAAPGGLDGAVADADAQRVVLILQQHLLPTGLPIFPQIRLAGRHLAAPRVPGGGCFDVFALAGGTIALMAGHAPGHGPQAVAALAELRTVFRRALDGGAGLADALTRMDEFAAATRASRGTTACVALLDPANGSVRYTSAGHPMPLICAPADAAAGGNVTLLPAADDKPLGFGTGQPTVATAELARGAVLLLGGDGAGGGPGDDGRSGAERFAAAAGAALAGWIVDGQGRDGHGQPSSGRDGAGPAGSGGTDTAPGTRKPADADLADGDLADVGDRLCAAVAARLADGPVDGDVTVLAVHRLAKPGRGLSLRLPGEPTALRQLRARLAEWLDEVGASPLDRVDTELAVYEAAANAIVHGRPAQGTGIVTVDMSLDGVGGVLIQVADQGEWRPRTPAAAEDRPGGRGLAVISKVTDELTIAPSPDGTTVVMRRGLTHPVTVDRAPAP
jgi:anti-sigma regulatory factor (Ser/Thr protein kinase)